MQFQVIDTGASYVVAYPNHRGEFIAVLDCITLTAATEEAQRMNEERERNPLKSHGNRYLRQFN